MMIRDIHFMLKDGRNALIRSPRDEDIQGMLDYLYLSAGETEFILRYPEECSKYTAEGEKALFDRVNASDNEAMLVCLVEGKVAGNCQITWSKGMKTRHRAILQMELDFVEGNTRARALYEKMGFRITGVRPNAIRLKDGTLLNEYTMIREIRR